MYLLMYKVKEGLLTKPIYTACMYIYATPMGVASETKQLLSINSYKQTLTTLIRLSAQVPPHKLRSYMKLLERLHIQGVTGGQVG